MDQTADKIGLGIFVLFCLILFFVWLVDIATAIRNRKSGARE